MTNAENTYMKGDRVVVTDLRTGLRHPGVVTKVPTESGYMNVRYDSGSVVRVGKGFVHHEGQS